MILNMTSVPEVLKKRIGRQLREWVYLGARTGMSRGIVRWEETNDETIIKMVLDIPSQGLARISYAIDTYGSEFIDECLLECGNTTITDMLNDTAPFIEYCLELRDRKLGGEEWVTIVADLKTKIENEAFKWSFPFPPSYKSIWGD